MVTVPTTAFRKDLRFFDNATPESMRSQRVAIQE